MKLNKLQNLRRIADDLTEAMKTGTIYAVLSGRKITLYTARKNGGPLDCIGCDIPAQSPWKGCGWEDEAKFTVACILPFATGHNFSEAPSGTEWTKWSREVVQCLNF